MDFETMVLHENDALKRFVSALGFDPKKVIDALSNDADYMCKSMALEGLRVTRDFSQSMFGESGVQAANDWLDGLQQAGHKK